MNRFGSNSFENENDQFAENQRIGRQLAENNPRPWSETYDPQRTYQGRHHSHPNYRPDYPTGRQRHYGHRYTGGQNAYNKPHFYAGAHNDYPANDPAWRHHDDKSWWTERNDFKDDDYRYRSGHRNFWHEDYDDMYEADRHPRHRRHPESFIGHIGEGIREGWNNLVHRHPERREERYEERRSERRYPEEPRHWPNPGNYSREQERSLRAEHEAKRWEDEQRRREYDQRRLNESSGRHNAGPNHRDEDSFDARNYRL